MKVLLAKVKDGEETCRGRYLKGLRSQNGEHLVNLRIKR